MSATSTRIEPACDAVLILALDTEDNNHTNVSYDEHRLMQGESRLQNFALWQCIEFGHRVARQRSP